MILYFNEIEQAALQLTEKDRAELAKRLIHSLDKQLDVETKQPWIDEVKRRKAELSSGKVTPLSGIEVHKAAREVLKK